MEKTRKLYPLKFQPILSERTWGSEKTGIADLGIEDSVVAEGWLEGNSIGEIMETYLEKAVGEYVYSYYGRQFPLLVKFLDINGEMPVYVHPDDEVAGQRYDALGGKELWYIDDAGEDSALYIGFSRDIPAAEVYEKCLDGSIKDAMNVIRPRKGDFLTIDPGTVHSASGKGLRIIVVKESSDLPFRLYDRDEDSAALADTHLAEAMDFISYSKYDTSAKMNDGRQGSGGHDETMEKLAECPEFNVTKIRLSDPLHIFSEESDNFILLVCIEGEASVQVPGTGADGKKTLDSWSLKCGETMLVPADVQDLYVVPVDRNTVLFEAAAGKRDDRDEYINPDTEPFLEGEDYEGLNEETEGKVSGTVSGYEKFFMKRGPGN